MILINFAHPVTEAQRQQIEALGGEPVAALHDVKVQFDHSQSFVTQTQALVESVPLDARAWQTERIVINPPSHTVIATALLTDLHGRMGYFPAVLRLRPILDRVPPAFEVAEIVNLQAIRDRARTQR